MKAFPPTPRLETVDDDRFASGHLWLLELIDGSPLRFQLQESGLISFGDDTRVYADSDDVPLPTRHAVRHVREAIDRDALRAAVDDVATVTFFGVATTHRTIAYDWDRIPSFLGVGVWSGGGSLPPDTAAQIFDRLGLDPVPVVERERRARDFDPETYELPQSAWYDGPAAGVLVRNKRGGRATLRNPDLEESDVSTAHDAEDLAAMYATDRRFERLARTLEDKGLPVDNDGLFELVIEDIAREAAPHFSRGPEPLDIETLRADVGARTQSFLVDRGDRM